MIINQKSRGEKKKPAQKLMVLNRLQQLPFQQINQNIGISRQYVQQFQTLISQNQKKQPLPLKQKQQQQCQKQQLIQLPNDSLYKNEEQHQNQEYSEDFDDQKLFGYSTTVDENQIDINNDNKKTKINKNQTSITDISSDYDLQEEEDEEEEEEEEEEQDQSETFGYRQPQQYTQKPQILFQKKLSHDMFRDMVQQQLCEFIDLQKFIDIQIEQQRIQEQTGFYENQQQNQYNYNNSFPPLTKCIKKQPVKLEPTNSRKKKQQKEKKTSWTCEICGKVFTKNHKQLGGHMRQVHNTNTQRDFIRGNCSTNIRNKNISCQSTPQSSKSADETQQLIPPTSNFNKFNNSNKIINNDFPL